MTNVFNKWVTSNSLPTEKMFFVGLEKESMRTEKHTQIATSPHPSSLGSALTHPYITTDFAEALLELISPPCADIHSLLDFIARLHTYITRHIGDETIWPTSMPPIIQDPQQIKIAEYGSSYIGMVRHIYRRGLALRYGKMMQTIAGIHFNLSLSDVFLEQHREFTQKNLSKSDVYFHIMRNYIRLSWLVNYLFGASPLMDKSFLNKQRMPPFLKELNASTYIHPESTCLRMSRLGYTNLTQDSFQLCFNQLDDYMKTMISMLTTEHKDYVKAGIKLNGDYLQLNTNLLQVENEYYAAIRPKATRTSQKKTIDVLAQRGVEYVEIRNLDLNPFLPLGIDEDQILFMQLLLCHCALTPSPHVDTQECHRIRMLDEKILMNNLKIGQTYENSWTLATKGTEIMKSMGPLAEMLEKSSHNGDLRYRRALRKQQEKFADQDLLPAKQLVCFVHDKNSDFVQAMAQLAEEHKQHYASIEITAEQEDSLNKATQRSWEDERLLREQSTGDFDGFVENYLAIKQVDTPTQ